jgi:hypothetical protein
MLNDIPPLRKPPGEGAEEAPLEKRGEEGEGKWPGSLRGMEGEGEKNRLMKAKEEARE